MPAVKSERWTRIKNSPILCSSPKPAPSGLLLFIRKRGVGEGDVPPHGLSDDCCLVIEHTQLSFVACGESQPCVFLAQGECHRPCSAAVSGCPSRPCCQDSEESAGRWNMPSGGTVKDRSRSCHPSLSQSLRAWDKRILPGCIRFWSWLEMTQAGKEVLHRNGVMPVSCRASRRSLKYLSSVKP